MDPSSPRWLTDLVEDDISISFPHHQYQMMLRSLDDYTLNDLNNFQSNSFPPNTSPLFDRTATCSTTTQPRNLEKSPSISSSSKMISFGGGADPICAAEVKPAKPDEFVLSKNINCCDAEHYQTAEDHTVGALSSRFGQGNYKGKQAICNINGGISSRKPIYGQEHVVAERKRREKISQRLIALSAVLPDLKRMDKASVLEEATKYVKHLQERIKKLEMEVAKKTVESVVVVKKTAEDNSSSSDEQTSTFQASDKHLLEIEARVSQKHVLIRVHCERRTGCSAKILDRIGKMNLTVLNNSVLSFGTSLLDITVVAQMEVEFSLTIEELVKNLRRDVLQFM